MNNYIQNKLDEFPYFLGSDEMTKQTKKWIEQSLTDYHNHIVEKIKTRRDEMIEKTGVFRYDSLYDDILSLLQDTNPKE